MKIILFFVMIMFLSSSCEEKKSIEKKNFKSEIKEEPKPVLENEENNLVGFACVSFQEENQKQSIA